MVYNVKAQAFKRTTGEASGKSRVEKIDTVANLLFTRCKTVMDVKKVYEAFWNEMNPNSEDVVFVQRISIQK